MYTKRLFVVFFLLFIGLKCYSQYNPFFQSYGAINDFTILSLDTVHDGGYITCGIDQTSNGGDFLIIKTDIDGIEEWRYHNNKFDGLDSTNTLYSIKETLDKGFIGIGNIQKDPISNYYDNLIVKLDSLGSLEWEKEYDFAFSDWLTTIYEKEDTSYIISGTANDDNVFLKLNSQGDTIWTKVIPKLNSQTVFKVSKIFKIDTCYYYLGYTDSIMPSLYSFGFTTIIKTNISGNLIWSKNFRDTSSVYGTSYFQLANDTTFLINCAMKTSNSLYYVQQKKIDLQGNWISTTPLPFGGKFESDSILYYPQSGFVNSDSLYLKKGNFITGGNRNIYGFFCHDCFFLDFIIDRRKNILICGSQSSLGVNGILVKGIDTLVGLGNEELLSLNHPVKVYPNPASEWLNFEVNTSTNYNLQLYNSLGSIVKEYSNLHINNFSINVSSLERGFYYYILNNSRQKIAVGKIVLK
ncbi:MAG: T9SS type A sorting domain-containing protein [Bacteroidetes bacterium]|nr:T9SS type A sorting domain-containing protein [Bacteroidota bacterium]